MLITSSRTRLLLEHGQSTRLTEARAAQLASAGGTLWVTIDNDPRDIVLEFGDSLEIEGNEPVVVSSIGGPAVMDLRPGPLRLIAEAASSARPPVGARSRSAGPAEGRRVPQ